MFRYRKPIPGAGKGLLKTVIEVTCPACKETYNIRTNETRKLRNCRCTKGAFEVYLSGGFNHVRVYYIDSFNNVEEFKNWRIISQS